MVKYFVILSAVFTVAALILAGCGSSAASSTGTLTTIPPTVGNLQIIVTDNANTPLSGAKVVSQNQPQGQLSVNGLTTETGVFFNGIKPGTYQFAVSRADFTASVAVVEVIGGQSIQITMSLQK
jgi:hypothetical protein